MQTPQTYQNHTRQVPRFFLVASLILTINVLRALYALTHGLTLAVVWDVLVAFALLVIASYARTFALAVQDRVIRLEMRLRLTAVLPADTARRAAALPVKMLVALRFASDQELPALVDDVLNGRLSTPKAVKQAVKDWQGDFLRA